MQMNIQGIPPVSYTGSCSLDGVQGIFQRTDFSLRQSLFRPDSFDGRGRWHRIIEVEGKPVVIHINPSGTVFWKSQEPVETPSLQNRLCRLLRPFSFPTEAAAHLPTDLATRFLGHSPLVHIASASLGEALLKAITRQVISAGQAKKLLHRFVVEYGPSMEYDETTSYGFPSLERLVHLSQESLVSCGFGYKARIMLRVARDLLDTHLEEKIQGIPAEDAVALLQQLNGVGRWTARVAICDLIGDWTVYPFEDLAVRTWAPRLWPSYPWPREEKAFLQAWQDINGQHTGIVTCYLLAQII